MKPTRKYGPVNRVSTYLKAEIPLLVLISITGIIYNVGLALTPYLEGQLAQTLSDFLRQEKTARDMIILACIYMGVILFVQLARFFKRLCVRYFANRVNKRMKEALYASLLQESTQTLLQKNEGDILTRGIADVDTCVEGIRKITTEIFDTGIVLISYAVLLLLYDWRLALIVMVFPPLAYLAAALSRKKVVVAAKEAKESESRLSEATLDRSGNAITYRIFGEEENQEKRYETYLDDYEKKEGKSAILETTLQPLYRIIAFLGLFFVLWLGVNNVKGTGWTVWNIAAFTAFLSCYLRLAFKSSRAAKLVNSAQKAKVSWVRVKPLLQEERPKEDPHLEQGQELKVDGLSFAYPEGKPLFENISFSAKPGEIIGITGEVASGKSTLGKMFLNELSYQGEIYYGDKELRSLPEDSLISYQGHQSELISESVEENVMLGKEGDCLPFLEQVEFLEDLKTMPEGIKTIIGNGGVRLSGGQQQRIALARTLAHARPVLVLDDPFSAVDKKTEAKIFTNLRSRYPDTIILLISHRLDVFSSCDHVLFLNGGQGTFASPDSLYANNPTYRRLVDLQSGGNEE